MLLFTVCIYNLVILFTPGAVILLGKASMFRFNHPGQVAQLKKEFKGVRLGVIHIRKAPIELVITKTLQEPMSIGYDRACVKLSKQNR